MDAGQSCKCLGRGVQHDVELRAIVFAEHGDVPVERAAGEDFGHQVLIEVGRAEVDIAFGSPTAAARTSSSAPSPRERRAKTTSRTCRMNDRIAFRVEDHRLRRVAVVVTQLAISVVLNEIDFLVRRAAADHLDQGGTPGGRHAYATGIVEVRRDIDGLHPFQLARLPSAQHFLFDSGGDDALRVARDAHRPHAQITQHTQINEITGRRTEDDVARVERMSLTR